MNYKPHHAETIIASGATVVVPHLGQVIELADAVNIAAAADSLELIGTAGAYEIPDGFTFHPIRVKILADVDAGSTSSVLLYKGATENALTSLKATLFLPTGGVTSDWPMWTEYLLPAGILITKETFLVYDPTAAEIYYISCTGYLLAD